ncbi:hypothetical protein [Roseisolibacter sp. H3M3-2]|uniref:hypothetical protein n=1 Tax=Roseisolibacter sp. H3M3-2 TaxID=3031323 RepID=UPI0023DC88F4|nr:hypothetical protein [Roseisolibacter sp. H3M3-2]MDF1502043.1 hypothetical protein [Roseisolibacter sp. H3M3-2]
MSAPAAPAGERIVLPVQLRRQQRVELLRGLLEHGPAAVTLLGAGLAGVGRGGSARVLGVVEVAASVWLLALLGRELRHVVRADDDASAEALAPIDETALPARLAGVDWLGVASAALLALEVWHRWAETGRIVRPFVLTAAFTLAMALGGRRLVARRVGAASRAPRLVLTPEGFDYRASRRKRFAAAWADVAAAESGPDAIQFRLRDGRDFALRARDHVRGAALVAAVRDALPRLAPALAAGAPPP